MKPFRLGLAAALAALAAGPAWAQGIPFGGPAYQPPVNPILNLTRQGAPAGLNYYNIVQPQLQFQASIAQLQQQTNQIQGGLNAVGPGTSLATGHPVAFGNYSHYYALRGFAGAGGAGRAGAGTGSFQLGTGGAFGGQGRVGGAGSGLGVPPTGSGVR